MSLNLKYSLPYLILFVMAQCAIGQQIYHGEKTVIIRNDTGQTASLQIIVNEKLKDAPPVSAPRVEYQNIPIKPGELIQIASPLTLTVLPGSVRPPEVKNEGDLFYLTTAKRLKSGQNLRKAAFFHVSILTDHKGRLTLSYSFSDHLSPVRDESVADGPPRATIYSFPNIETILLDVSKPEEKKEP